MQVVYVILAQGLLGAVLAGVFLHFSRLYQRVFLRTLGWSWLAFSVYMLVSAVITAVFRIGSNDPVRLALSVVAQLGCYFQIAFLLMGSLELIRQKACNRTCFLRVVIAVVVLALVTSLLYSFDPEASQERYLLRVGSRTAFSGIGFLIAAGLTFFKRAFTRGVGKMVLTASLAVYGGIQLYYFAIVVLTLAGFSVAFPHFFGLFEVFAICLVGIGMVIWLLEDERERLRKTNQELDRFLYSTSHDLRAPIASVLGLTQISKSETNITQLRHYNELIEDRVRKLDTVIGDILALSRSTKAELQHVRIDFFELVESAIQDIRFHEATNQIELRIPRKQGVFFDADPAQMKIVVANLVGNAVKYHNLLQDKPFVEIDCLHRPTEFVFWVKDNGEGIPAEFQTRIFEMFFRASRKTDGTGLGLYIVKEALEKIGGTIELQSVYGQGSTFTVRIPKN
jgi:signal transduction histidine kinase